MPRRHREAGRVLAIGAALDGATRTPERNTAHPRGEVLWPEDVHARYFRASTRVSLAWIRAHVAPGAWWRTGRTWVVWSASVEAWLAAQGQQGRDATGAA